MSTHGVRIQLIDSLIAITNDELHLLFLQGVIVVDRQKPSFNDAAVAALAKQIFVERFGRSQISYKQLTINAFRAARDFMNEAQSIQDGETDLFADDRNPLDEVYAPNLKQTHPINLMSRKWGNLEKVKAVLAELEANPAAETYRELDWGKPEVNTARLLFPAVIERAQQSSKVK